MSININLATIKPKLTNAFRWAHKHMILLGIVFVVLLYGWLVLQINLLNRREPSEDAVTEKLQTIKRPRVDEKTVEKLQQLEDNSTEVKAIFKQARDNPFQE